MTLRGEVGRCVTGYKTTRLINSFIYACFPILLFLFHLSFSAIRVLSCALYPSSRPHHALLTPTLFYCISQRDKRKRKTSVRFTTSRHVKELPRCSLLLPLPFYLCSHVSECYSYPYSGPSSLYSINSAYYRSYLFLSRRATLLSFCHTRHLSSDWLKLPSVQHPSVKTAVIAIDGCTRNATVQSGDTCDSICK